MYSKSTRLRAMTEHNIPGVQRAACYKCLSVETSGSHQQAGEKQKEQTMRKCKYYALSVAVEEALGVASAEFNDCKVQEINGQSGGFAGRSL